MIARMMDVFLMSLSMFSRSSSMSLDILLYFPRSNFSSSSLLQVDFHDIIAEPEGIHSSDCVWTLAFKCFTCSKNLCYVILTILCAIPLAFCWGCEFACVAFCHIWSLSPALKIIEINCVHCRKLFTALLECLLGPICETCGLVFSKIEVTNKTA